MTSALLNLFIFCALVNFADCWSSGRRTKEFAKPKELLVVDSSVPIRWTKFDNGSSTVFGLLEEEADGSDYVVKEVKDRKNKQFGITVRKVEAAKNSTKQVNTTTSYNETFARTKILPLAAAAYSDLPQLCLNHSFANASLFRKVNVSCEKHYRDDVCSGFTAVSHSDCAIIVSFRGTNSYAQLILETGDTTVRHQSNSSIGGQVGSYFEQVFKLLWINNTIGQDVYTLQRKYPDYELWITGHSLGGALASLAAAQVAADGKFNTSRIKLYTLGQPRTGNQDFADAMDKLAFHNNTFRITHAKDLVVHTPPHSFQNYTHHKTEVWYNNKMSINDTYTSICDDQQESKNCSNSVRYIFSVSDHFNYFGQHVSLFGRAGCVAKKSKKSIFG